MGFLGFWGILLFALCAFIPNNQVQSTSQKTDKPIIKNQINTESATSADVNLHLDKKEYQLPESPKSDPPRTQIKHSFSSNGSIQYRAKQVISRDDTNKKSQMPTGANFIGKLLTAVDSRDLSSLIKVLLPYGMKFKGEEFVERDSILIGKATYTGKGDRFFLTFEQAILPNGDEKPINAYALDTSDYSNGVVGEYHSESGVRIASTLGLTLVSGMADVLTEKTSLGDGFGSSGVVTMKSNMKNAAFHGVSKVTEMEASRQGEALAQTPPYVTLEAGKDIIITLTGAYGEKE